MAALDCGTVAYLTVTITPELWLLCFGKQYQSIIHPLAADSASMTSPTQIILLRSK